MNWNLADKKVLSSLTFLSIISSAIDHVTCHVIVSVKNRKDLTGRRRFLEKTWNKNAFLIKIKYIQSFTFGMIVHCFVKKNICQDKGHFLVQNSTFHCQLLEFKTLRAVIPNVECSIFWIYFGRANSVIYFRKIRRRIADIRNCNFLVTWCVTWSNLCVKEKNRGLYSGKISSCSRETNRRYIGDHS